MRTGGLCRFVIEPLGSEYYAYSIKVTGGKGFEIAGSSVSNGEHVTLGDYSGQDNQLWILYAVGDGYNLIWNTNSNLCIDISGGSNDDSTVIQQYDCGQSNAAQLWKLEDWQNVVDVSLSPV
ncbi:hypothetical protein TSOC_002616 [Tetrabaena socialis]|uniref:Ricin B lectin domain-containing protein n=1 Tax=Tetrabaena socialis TaxID=47790 RepID=A0A2J8ADP6_9CHLO|nr:hypothetical protein TSOC_002616 [Tetrabaena socialis]|eukprot:PNH10634.1 hypothetical protein TSOC_002616 [Tetrabaena socialis]